MRSLLAIVSVVAALIFAGQSSAAPPVLTSVGHVQRHPQANWSLPPGVSAEDEPSVLIVEDVS